VNLTRKRAVGFVVAAEIAVLGVAVGAFLDSEEPTTFPSAVPVAEVSASRSRSTPVAVNVQLNVVGVTSTTAALTRGGHAQGVRVASGQTSVDSGTVGYRRLSHRGR
jgi:hypothetical protein